MSIDTPGLVEEKRRTPSENRSVSESEDTIRNLKASQSVEAAFDAVGIPSPPSDVAAIITNQVKSAIKNLPLSQVANMTPGSGVLSTSATAAVEQYLSMLSPSQRRAAEQGVNGLGPGGMLRFHALLQQFDGAGVGGGSRSGAKYDGLSSNGDWSSPAGQAQMRELAIKSGLGWAANNPDLLRMGPAAIQVLADVKMREETYKRMTGAGLKKEAVVGFASLSKKNGDDSETTNKNGQKLADDIKDINSGRYTGAVNRYLELNQPGRSVPRSTMDAAKKEIEDAGEEVKKQHPEKGKSVEDSQKMLHISTEKNVAVTQAVTKQAASVISRAQEARAAASKNDDLLTSLNSPPPDTTRPVKAAKSTEAPKGDTAKADTASKSERPKPTQTAAVAKPSQPKV